MRAPRIMCCRACESRAVVRVAVVRVLGSKASLIEREYHGRQKNLVQTALSFFKRDLCWGRRSQWVKATPCVRHWRGSLRNPRGKSK